MNKPGKWKVLYNPMGGYIVARVRDVNATVHSGNLEYYGNYLDDKTERQAIADELNGGNKNEMPI